MPVIVALPSVAARMILRFVITALP